MGEWIFSLTSMAITHLAAEWFCTRSTFSDVKPVLQCSTFPLRSKIVGDLCCHISQRRPALAAIREVAPKLRTQKKLTAMTAQY
jgi:hypothetical protein